MSEANNQQKDYTKEDLTVTWKPDVCQHSGNCVKNLKSVFNPRNRPWINLDNATKEEIMKAIDTCPSGALSYKTEK